MPLGRIITDEVVAFVFHLAFGDNAGICFCADELGGQQQLLNAVWLAIELIERSQSCQIMGAIQACSHSFFRIRFRDTFKELIGDAFSGEPQRRPASRGTEQDALIPLPNVSSEC